MSEYVPPEKAHSPGIIKVMRPFAEDIQKESGASRVIITCTYELKGTAEKMNVKMSVSTDNKMERTDAAPPKPKGTLLATEAEQVIRKILGSMPEDKGE